MRRAESERKNVDSSPHIPSCGLREVLVLPPTPPRPTDLSLEPYSAGPSQQPSSPELAHLL